MTNTPDSFNIYRGVQKSETTFPFIWWPHCICVSLWHWEQETLPCRGPYTHHVLDYYSKACVFAIWFVHACHCVFIRCGVGWRKAQTPMMHLSSLFCRVRAAHGFVCLSHSSRLVASEARSRSLPSPLLQSSLTHSFIHSFIPIGHCCPFLSLLCVLPSFLICYETLLHSHILPLPLAPVVKPLNITVLFLWHSERLWSPTYCLLF